MILKSEWVWYGYAGHLCVSRRCAYHLCTRIGGWLISTVGAYYPDDGSGMRPIASDPDNLFETMVFPCEGEDEYGNPNSSLSEISRRYYKTSIDAERGHRAICQQVAEEEDTV